MRSLSSIKRAGIIAMTVVCSSLLFSHTGRAAGLVLPGFDLFQTGAPTTFMGVPFAGVPLGTFDFGAGPVAVGNTDTIVHRLGPSMAPGPLPDVPIEMVALQLVSVVPFDAGAGLDFHYITLQSARGGPVSPGHINVIFGPEAPIHGTFDSFFDVFFDIRKGALNGPIVASSDLMLTGSGNPWGHDPLPGTLQIDGVNHNLNGTDTSNDFVPFFVMESHPSGAMHTAQPAQPVPIPFGFSPGLGVALCSGLVGLGHLRRKLACKRRAG